MQIVYLMASRKSWANMHLTKFPILVIVNKGKFMGVPKCINVIRYSVVVFCLETWPISQNYRWPQCKTDICSMSSFYMYLLLISVSLSILLTEAWRTLLWSPWHKKRRRTRFLHGWRRQQASILCNRCTSLVPVHHSRHPGTSAKGFDNEAFPD